MTIEERVEQLEAQVAQLTGEGTYTLGKAGETIDAILDGIETGAIYHGTQEVTSDGTAYRLVGQLSLGFTPTRNTVVAASLRRGASPNPTGYGYTLELLWAGMLYYHIFWGGNRPDTTSANLHVDAGTYYIDWIVLDKGES